LVSLVSNYDLRKLTNKFKPSKKKNAPNSKKGMQSMLATADAKRKTSMAIAENRRAEAKAKKAAEAEAKSTEEIKKAA
jgi:hypothetical protein